MSEKNKDLLMRAWSLAEQAYGDPEEAECFMENAQPACLGTYNTEDHFKTPTELIQRDGQAGFDKVSGYLKTRSRKLQMA